MLRDKIIIQWISGHGWYCASKKSKYFVKVMLLLHEVGFNVVGISVDNAAANRKFYKDFLCDGKWRTSIEHPFTGGKIFLIFDPTHVIKNIYNNLLTKKMFKLPELPPIKLLQQHFQILLLFMTRSARNLCELPTSCQRLYSTLRQLKK